MFKNTSGQKLTVFAFDSTTNLPKTGDAANLTAYRDLDDGGVTVLGDTSATEKDSTNAKGYYIFDLTQGETNGDKILFTCKSATANIVVVCVPAVVYTLPATGILAPATAGRTLVVDANGLADANMVKMGPTGSGTALTARDIGASVLISSGTGTGQLDVTSGRIKADTVYWAAAAVAAVNVSGVPKVDVVDWLGTAPSTPTVAGVPNVNVKTINDVATTSVTAVSANQGTTQPLNFTGTAGSALVKSDMVDIAGAAVSASQAQIGVNVVNIGGSVAIASAGRPEVNVTHWKGTGAAVVDTAGYPVVTIKDGTGQGELSTTSGRVDADVLYWNGSVVATPVIAGYPLTDAIDAGTAQSASATGLVIRAAAAFANSELKGNHVTILTATTGAGQTRKILDNIGSTDTLVVDTWATTPSGTITYMITPGPPNITNTSYLPDMNVKTWIGEAIPATTTTGVPKIDVRNWNGSAVPTPNTNGYPLVDVFYVNNVQQTGRDIGASVLVGDKTGFKLASDGLDSISVTAPTGVASNFREMLVQLWRRFFKKSTLTSTTLVTLADDGSTPVTTQTVSDDGVTQTQGPSA